MAAPSMTTGSAGNIRASASLAASGTANYDVDFSAVYEGQVQVGATFGTIAATAGLQVQVFCRVGTTPVTDNVAGPGSFTLAAVSGAQAQTIKLQTGRYNIKITNLDATNGLTSAYITDDTISGIS